MRQILTILLCGITLALSAAAQNGELSEAEIQLRTERISKTLRCVVCQNQSIYDSNAPLAADMRRLVEQRVRAGDNDDEVRDFLREPYGDFILMRPPVQTNTFLLWFSPVALVLGALLWFFFRPKVVNSGPGEIDISDSERHRLQDFLGADHDEAKK